MGTCDFATTMEWTKPCSGNVMNALLFWIESHVSHVHFPFTHRSNWDCANFQVVGAVAFQNRKLSIPPNTSPVLVSLMDACWAE